jgi:hypothetical protein
MCTFISDQLLNLEGFFFFGLQFIRVWLLALPVFQLIGHGGKDNENAKRETEDGKR